MKRHREEEEEPQAQVQDDTAQSSCVSAATSDGMELRCLTDALELVKQVRKLNLGVLPVQCPEFCYRRAARDDNQLSWAAMANSTATATAQNDGNGKDASNKSSRDNTKVVGAIIAEYEAPYRAVHIRTLAVEPAFRRQGVGRQLVDKVIQQTLALMEDAVRVESIRLHVHVGNDDGIAFYEQMGFAHEARLEDYYRHLEPRACLVLSYALPLKSHEQDGKVKQD